MNDLRCDFCSEQPVVARYHADDFIVKAFSVGGLEQGSPGDWAACRTCELLIDTGQWDHLIARVTSTFFEQHPGMREAVHRDVLQEQLYDLYAQLLQHDFRKVAL